MARRAKVGEILLRAGLIDEMQLRSALGDQKRWGGRVGLALVKLGFVSERDLVRALATQLDIPIAAVSGKRIPSTVLGMVSPEFAEKNTCIPLFVREEAGCETLFLGMDDPGNLDVLDELSFKINMPVRAVMVAPSEICEGLDRFYRDTGSATPAWKQEETNGASEESLEFEREVPRQAVETTGLVTAAAVPTASSQLSQAPPHLVSLALCQLLIEKGLLDRAELEARIRILQDA